jgi:hypothetical protein
MAESQSILSQLQQKKADIEHQLQKMQGLDELSGDEYEEPEEEQEEEQEEEPEEEDTKEEDKREPEETKEESEKPVFADYKSEDDDRLARKIDSIIEKKTIVRKCQKKVNTLIGEIKFQLDGIMDNLDDCKSIDSKDLLHLATEYEELMEEFALCYGNILEELPEGYTLPKAYTDKVEKDLDAIEADVNKYLA